MKRLESFAPVLSATGYALISCNFLLVGFAVAIAACSCLAPVFYKHGLKKLFLLELFFLTMSLIGFFNQLLRVF